MSSSESRCVMNKASIKRISPLKTVVLCGFLCLCTSVASAGQLEDVASVIAAEACSQGEIGMHAVASTIQNRARARHIPPGAVVKQKNQYFGWTNKNRLSIYKQCKREADVLAVQVINGTLPDIVSGAQYFLLPTEPKRKWHGVKTVVIGSHTFYKERTLK